jgi:hemolysin III
MNAQPSAARTLRRTRQAERKTLLDRFKLPDYTACEELINSVSHIIGAVFGVVAMILMLVAVVPHGTVTAGVSAAIFGLALVALYTNSAVYHGWRIGKAKKVFQILDHCTIFLLITGTYAPFALVAIGGVLGFAVFGFVSAVSLVGIILNIVDLKKYSVLSMICYLVTGWCIILAFPHVKAALTGMQLSLLVWGGISYTVGAVVYGIGNKVRYMHSVWHFFVLGGSVLHFISIYNYLLLNFG